MIITIIPITFALTKINTFCHRYVCEVISLILKNFFALTLMISCLTLKDFFVNFLSLKV